ncbi:FeoB-associated Cys-rich membrane protein [Opitutaceae bacterium]|nr:FeoB-associated Cys-rich membrane protein [Opitutaceae bacterium]
MSAETQSIVAVLIVVAAAGYLGRRWWRNRQRARQGCGGAGECACPSTKISSKPNA